MTDCSSDPYNSACTCSPYQGESEDARLFDPVSQRYYCCGVNGFDGKSWDIFDGCKSWRASGIGLPYASKTIKISDAESSKVSAATKFFGAIQPFANGKVATDGTVTYPCDPGKTPRILDYESYNGGSKYSSNIICVKTDGSKIDVSSLPTDFEYAIYQIKSCPKSFDTSCTVPSGTIGIRDAIGDKDFATPKYNGSGNSGSGGDSKNKKYILGMSLMTFIIVLVVVVLLVIGIILALVFRPKCKTS